MYESAFLLKASNHREYNDNVYLVLRQVSVPRGDRRYLVQIFMKVAYE